MRCTLRWLTPAAFAIARPVQCVLSPGGSASVISTTRSTAAGVSAGLPPGRVASCSNPSTPSAMKRACQRQIVGLPLPVCRWIAIVPTPAALSRTIRARQTCFCALFPDPITASSRSRSPGPSRTSTPALIQPDSHIREPTGIIYQRQSTRVTAPSLERHHARRRWPAILPAHPADARAPPPGARALRPRECVRDPRRGADVPYRLCHRRQALRDTDPVLARGRAALLARLVGEPDAAHPGARHPGVPHGGARRRANPRALRVSPLARLPRGYGLWLVVNRL